MHLVVIARDKADAGLRRRHRADHLDYVSGYQDRIIYAGPLIDDGRTVVSLFFFDLPSREVLDDYLAGYPYFTAPIFDRVEIFESRWIVPEQKRGFLREEAARARERAGG